MNFFTSLGKVFAFVLALICFENTRKGNWRLMMMLNGVVSIMGPFFIYFYVLESPRFLIASNKF
jgi:putative MFS transporter